MKNRKVKVRRRNKIDLSLSSADRPNTITYSSIKEFSPKFSTIEKITTTRTNNTILITKKIVETTVSKKPINNSIISLGIKSKRFSSDISIKNYDREKLRILFTKINTNNKNLLIRKNKFLILHKWEFPLSHYFTQLKIRTIGIKKAYRKFTESPKKNEKFTKWFNSNESLSDDQIFSKTSSFKQVKNYKNSKFNSFKINSLQQLHKEISNQDEENYKSYYERTSNKSNFDICEDNFNLKQISSSQDLSNICNESEIASNENSFRKKPLTEFNSKNNSQRSSIEKMIIKKPTTEINSKNNSQRSIENIIKKPSEVQFNKLPVKGSLNKGIINNKLSKISFNNTSNLYDYKKPTGKHDMFSEKMKIDAKSKVDDHINVDALKSKIKISNKKILNRKYIDPYTVRLALEKFGFFHFVFIRMLVPKRYYFNYWTKFLKAKKKKK